MNDFQTGMIESLRLVYQSHGGLRAVPRSGYFISSFIISLLCWRSVDTESWQVVALSALPTLAGFSIAAYAILFAVLDEKSRAALARPEPKFNGRSPLLIIVSIVSHAVIVQIVELLYAFVFAQKPFPAMDPCVDSVVVNRFFSAFGLFLLVYGVMLVLASILSLFRILEIRTRV